MLVFPNAKINIGLKILAKREDGFHNIETVFQPVRLCDILEIIPKTGAGESQITLSGLNLEGKPEENLCLKAWHKLKKKFNLPPVHIHLHKVIPAGAGLGGGSSDASHVIKVVNELYHLNLTPPEMISLASETGSDCSFFITNETAFATGRGEVLERAETNLKGLFLRLVVPSVHVSTKLAYSRIMPSRPDTRLNELIHLPVTEWKDRIKNDFEEVVFDMFPEIRSIKEHLYHTGALYSAMSGSGSAVYGIFKTMPPRDKFLSGYFLYEEKL